MMIREFGNTGLRVSLLGYGAGGVGRHDVEEPDVEKLLHGVLDAGVTLIDTARGYGLSEERIGRYLSGRRDEFILSTKVGYDVEGHEDWTPGCITAGIDAALKRLQTDVIDIVHFHSCESHVLQQVGLVEALLRAVDEGKVRVPAYSGDNEHLQTAVGMPEFQSVMASFNICDQRILQASLPAIRERDLGLIVKRPVANAPWRFETQPFGEYVEEYWLRFQAMGLDLPVEEWPSVALRYAAFTEGVSSCIVGTMNLDHLQENCEIVTRGPLESDVVEKIEAAFSANDDGWVSQV